MAGPAASLSALFPDDITLPKQYQCSCQVECLCTTTLLSTRWFVQRLLQWNRSAECWLYCRLSGSLDAVPWSCDHDLLQGCRTPLRRTRGLGEARKLS